MSQSTCILEGCDRPRRHREWCVAHYARWLRYGDTGSVEIRPQRAGALPGEANHQWRGDNIGYAAVHRRLRVQRGPARLQPCISCGGQADDWAYQHDADDEQICKKVELPFTTDLSHYKPMCHLCHRQFDVLHGWAAPTRKGRAGVSRVSGTNRWRAYVRINGRQISGGRYATREAAQAAADQLREDAVNAMLNQVVGS